MQTQPKILVREKVPARFADVIKHVATLIANGDESTTIESDDLLQDDEHDYFGGLIDSDEMEFGFTFFPEPFDEDAEDGPEFACTEWTYILSKQQIADIASGSLGELDMWRCASGDCANRFATADGYCGKCDI